MTDTPQETIAYRVPPFSEEAEQAVLGCMLLDKDLCASLADTMLQMDFYQKQNQAVFEAMWTLLESNQPVDTLTVYERLRQKGLLDLVGGAEYLAWLAEAVPCRANAKYYGEIVRRSKLSRDLALLGSEVVQGAYREDKSGPDLLGEVLSRAQGLMAEHAPGEREDSRQLVSKALAAADPTKEGDVPGTATGFTNLDHKLRHGKLQPGDLIYLAARPSVGKTTWALNVTRNVLKRGGAVLFFTLEMTPETLVEHILINDSGVASGKIGTKMMSDAEVQAYTAAAGRLYDWKLTIDATPSMDLRHIQGVVRRQCSEQSLDLVVVDYVQLMRLPKAEKQYIRVGLLSHGLKVLARECNVPLMALSQLSRQPESRKSKRPRVSDLRESGDLEQDADVILLLYRPEHEDAQVKNATGFTEVLLGKQRNGPTGWCAMKFSGQLYRFEPWRGEIPKKYKS